MGKFDLDGRVALVTGGAGGIGAATARALKDAGAAVMITDIDGDAAASAAAAGGFAHCQHDVCDEAAWERAVAATIAALGGLDIVINNAGIEISSLIIDQPVDALRRMLDVNVVGTVLGMKHGFRAMRPQGPAGKGGCIVNIASVAATIPFPGISGYAATKSAVDRLTRIAAVESGKLGYGVRVNCLYPGLVPTAMGSQLANDMAAIGLWPSAEAAVADVVGMTPLGRLGTVEDMADAAVFLCSDAARFITGTGLSIDGGMGS